MLSAGSNESKPFAPERSHIPDAHTHTIATRSDARQTIALPGISRLQEGLVEKPRLAQSARLLDERIA